MKIKLKSPRVLTKESKSLRKILIAEMGIKVTIDKLRNILSTCIGYKNFNQFEIESKNGEGRSIESLNAIDKRKLLLKIKDTVYTHYPLIDYKGFHCLDVLISDDREILANVPPFTPADFVKLNPAIGLKKGSILKFEEIDKEILEKSLYFQLGYVHSNKSMISFHSEMYLKLANIIDDKHLISSLREKHMYARTLLLSMFNVADKKLSAENRGINPHTEFQFIKNRDRILWFALLCLKSKESFIESAFLLSVFKDENLGIKTESETVIHIEKYLNSNIESFVKEASYGIDDKFIENKFSKIRKDKKIKNNDVLVGTEINNKKDFIIDSFDLSHGVFGLGGVGSGIFRVLNGFIYNDLVDGRGGLIIDAFGGGPSYFNIVSYLKSVGREADLILINNLSDLDKELKIDIVKTVSFNELVSIIKDELSGLTSDISKIIKQILPFLLDSININNDIETFEMLNIKLRRENIFKIIDEAASLKSIELKSSILDNFDSIDDFKESYNHIELLINNSILYLQDNLSNAFYNYGDLDFHDAIKSNKIIFVMTDNLALDINVPNFVHKFVTNRYFEALNKINSEKTIHNFNECFNLPNPFMVLCECNFLSPKWLKENFEVQRYRSGLKPIVIQRYLDTWFKIHGNEIYYLMNYLRASFILKNEQINCTLLTDWLGVKYQSKVTASEIRGQSPGEAFYFKDSDCKRLLMSYIDYDFVKYVKVNRTIPLL
jgi:hypothetical protein